MASARRTSALGLGLILGLGCAALAAVILGAIFLLPLVFLGGGKEGAATGAGSGRTVVLIAVDDLRRDHLAFHGYRFDPTPTLTKLAHAGVVATDYVPASTATGPSVAAILTGLGPLGTGFTTARVLGAHRLPRAVPTLAVEFAEAGWRTAAAFALRQDADRLTGLARGFGDVLGAPTEGAPLTAKAAVSGLVAMASDVGGDDSLFAFLHLGDLRADDEPKLDDARLARWLARHFAPFRANDSEIARELERLEETVGASAGDIAALVGRRRGSPAWLALQEARYDARLEALDAALGELLRGLADLGREAPLVIVVGTRGRLLGVEPPAGGPPVELSEAVLATAMIAAGSLRRDAEGAPIEPWSTVGGPQSLALALRGEALGRGPSSWPGPADPVGPRVVIGPGLRWIALVRPDRKDVWGPGSPGATYGRPSDMAFSMIELLQHELVGGEGAWELELEPPADGELFLRVGSAGGDILGVAGDADEILAPPSRKSADVRARRAATARVRCATGREPFTLAVTGAGDEWTLVEQGPGGRGASEPLVSHLVPIVPARAAEGADGAEAAEAAVALEADGAWTRVRVSASGSVELALWLSPPNDTAQAPQVELASGDARVETFPGLDAVRVRGSGAAGSLELRIRRGGGQTVAVAAVLDGRVVQPGEMSSDKGGDPATLALYLPPVDVGAFQVLAGGELVLRARGTAVGLPMEPPYALTEKEARLLLRLGPLE